jgi:TM2 domain-containing membrane protein YozV
MQKSKVTTAVLCLLLGYLGIHRFYTGHTKVGIIQLLTGGGLGIWALWDFIQILRNRYVDGSGQVLG